MSTMNISLPDTLKQFVDMQVQTGEYSTSSEYIRELIRLDHKRAIEQRLNSLLLEGLESGEPILADEAFWAEQQRFLDSL